MRPEKNRHRGAAWCMALLLPAALPASAEEYWKLSAGSPDWSAPAAWTPGTALNGPGDFDVAHVEGTGVQLDREIDVGTFHFDGFNNSGPAQSVVMNGSTLNILDGGTWREGIFNGFWIGPGVVNFHGTFSLLGDVLHDTAWGTELNNYGTMLHQDNGSLLIGNDAVHFNNHGTYEITGNGQITTPGHGGEILTNFGVFRKSGGSGLSQVFAEFDNQGAVEVSSGELRILRPLQAPGPGTGLTLTGGTWLVYDGATLNYPVGVSPWEVSTNQGDVLLSGPASAFPPLDTLETNEGSFTIENGRDFAVAGILTNTGYLRVGAGCTLNVGATAPLDLQGGVLTGAGTIGGGVDNVAGVVEPGDSIGTLTVDGDYFQYGAATLSIELGATGVVAVGVPILPRHGGSAAPNRTAGIRDPILLPIRQSDLLNVTGTAFVDGELRIAHIDGGAITTGQEMVVLTAGSVTGTFSAVTGPGTYVVNYKPQEVTVTVIDAGQP